MSGVPGSDGERRGRYDHEECHPSGLAFTLFTNHGAYRAHPSLDANHLAAFETGESSSRNSSLDGTEIR